MVNTFTQRLETLDPNAFVLFAGDFNVYTSNEPAYQELLDPTNTIVMIDPIDTPGSWNNNIDFQDIHTQSTRISSGPFGAGAGGGLDDRFDFITISQNMTSNPKLRYVEGSYKAFGNNGNCYNNNISDSSCVGEFSQSLRNSLYSMSDHLPVVMQLETEEDILLSTIAFEGSEIEVKLRASVVSTEVEIEIPSEVTQPIAATIYNVLGQSILKRSSVHSENIKIDISHFAEGVYYIHTNLPNQQTLKFIKSF
ncbi:T9SS type A sorting domain-containing protein [Cochleicola gelatinilyticus]|uniref:Secretion system C-terminal sorting domain-containing protein n=1 Tax=Cochleicola gelatinilyticus TaxID=1763537 RepID=A0A167HQC9_9FLAO|nr:T9SS type A sorting domain-containing protein [Cochleicola gelatinilyticus]OAB78852.1 hypothetical protein ULVI_09735 [Cochleicola gelatinilyticus]